MTRSPCLEDIIAPLPVKSFLSDYWRRSLYLLRDRPRWIYAELAPPAAIEELIATLPLPADDWLSLVDNHPVPIGRTFFGPDNTIDLPRLYRAYENGFTVLLRRLHRRRRTIGLLCRAIERGLLEAGVLLADRVGANLYMTPPRSQGFDIHYDDHDALIIQLSGSKVWRIYDRLIEAPLCPADTPLDKSAMPGLLQEKTLSAGDLLYLPAGFPHEARAENDESVHLTLSLRPATIRDTIITLADRWTGLRRALPFHPASADGKRHIASVLRNLADYLEESDIMEHAVGDVEERVFRRLGVIPDQGFVQIGQLSLLNVDSIVELRPGMFGKLRRDREAVVVMVPARRMTCPIAFEPALESIFSHGRVRIRDLPGLGESDQCQLVRELVLAGVLRLVESSLSGGEDDRNNPKNDDRSLLAAV